jgi:hypothetical protein
MKRILSSLVMLTTLVTVAVTSAEAQKPGQQYRSFRHLETKKEYTALPNKAQMVFACAKCKSIATVTKKEVSPLLDAGEAWVLDHCPGCDGKITTKFDDKGDMEHTCTKCGADSAFCCCQAGKM